MSLPWKPSEPIQKKSDPGAPPPQLRYPRWGPGQAGTSYLPHFLQGKVFSWFCVLLNASAFFFFSVKGSALRDFPGPSLGLSEV